MFSSRMCATPTFRTGLLTILSERSVRSFTKAWSTGRAPSMTPSFLAHNMIEKSKMYDLDLQFVMQKSESDDEGYKKAKAIPQPPEYVPVKVVKDPLERGHMMVKLLEQKKQQLLDMQHVLKYVDGDAAGQQLSEPQCRYAGWAFRQFEKALKSYQWLVESGF